MINQEIDLSDSLPFPIQFTPWVYHFISIDNYDQVGEFEFHSFSKSFDLQNFPGGNKDGIHSLGPLLSIPDKVSISVYFHTI